MDVACLCEKIDLTFSPNSIQCYNINAFVTSVAFEIILLEINGIIRERQIGTTY